MDSAFHMLYPNYSGSLTTLPLRPSGYVNETFTFIRLYKDKQTKLKVFCLFIFGNYLVSNNKRTTRTSKYLSLFVMIDSQQRRRHPDPCVCIWLSRIHS